MDNEVFRGYLIKLLQMQGKSKKEIKEALNLTYGLFDEMSESGAQEYYYNY